MTLDRKSRAWIEVRAAALRRNLETVRAHAAPDARVIAMVKANAYGLGALRAAQALRPAGVWAWGVATLAEGREVRDSGAREPILVMSPLLPAMWPEAVEQDLTLVLSDLDGLSRLADVVRAVGRPARFHLEIDTGMGRAGVDFRAVAEWGARLQDLPDGVIWEGCLTHFHSADLADLGPTRRQAQRFHDTVARLPARPPGLILHACNSAGALRVPEYATGAIRPGIFLYGGAAGEGLPRPEPVVSVRARVLRIQDVPPGSTVGYGATHRAEGWARWATVGIGYGDGLPRALGNRGAGAVSGRRVPIVGRISMDLTVVDISGLDGVEVGDPVTFVGADGDASIPLSEVAAHASTIEYEILTGLSARLPRVWIEDGADIDGTGPDAA